MDTKDDWSYVMSITDSDASQLLRNALSVQKASEPVQENNRERISPQGYIDSLHAPSGDSSHLSRVPTYNLHGLAHSQSSSQLERQPEPGGSPKGAVSDRREAKQSSLSMIRSTLPHTAAHTVPSPYPNPQFPAAGQTTSGIKATRATAPQSRPVAHNTKGPAQKFFPSSHFDDSDLSSQDSFAERISPDPVLDYINQNKAFDMPLSELGRPSTQETHITASTVFRSPIRPPVNVKSPIRPPAGVTRVVPHNDRILVAGTPSNSEDSQSQRSPSGTQPILYSQQQEGSDSQNFISNLGRQRVEYDVDSIDLAVDVPSSDSSQLSSSYERLLGGEPEPARETQQTQPAEIEATQPSSVNENTIADVVATPPLQDAPLPLVGAASSVSHAAARMTISTGSTNPRSLINTINPNKAWRYARAVQEREQRETRQPGLFAGQPTGVGVLPATRVAEITVIPPPGSNDIVPETPQPGHSKASSMQVLETPRLVAPSSPLVAPRKARNSDPVHLEIVPDSEPQPVEESPIQPRQFRKGSSTSPVKKIRNDNQVEVAPDSIPAREEEEEEENDIPLLAASKRAQAMSVEAETVSKLTKRDYGKGVASTKSNESLFMPPPPPKKKGTKNARPSSSRAKKGKAKQAKTGGTTGQTRQTAKRKRQSPTVVPSSAPEQDQLLLSGTGKDGASTCSGTFSERSRSLTLLPSRSKKRRVVTESDEEAATFRQPALSKVEESTEPDDDRSVDDEAYSESHFMSGRRRQATRTATTFSRSSTRMSTRSFVAHAPGRSKGSHHINRTLKPMPTRVMALWKRDSNYYPGVIRKHLNGTRYNVLFDDDDEDDVSLKDIRRAEVREGDQVILDADGQRVDVVRVKKGATGLIISVQTEGEESEELEVEMGDILVPVRTILSHWEDRRLEAKSIVTCEEADRMGASHTLILAKTGLVTTLSPGTSGSAELRKQVRQMVESNGGVVLEDFSYVISMNGKQLNGKQTPRTKRRWVAEGQNVHWKNLDINRLFLLSDDASLKPKYLEAIALGIPCLSINWLHDITQGHHHSSGPMNWHRYLLPQGYAHGLNARVSQFVDLDWCNSPEHLQQIMNNTVAPKLLRGKSVLFIQAEHLPDAAPATPVPRILLAMGASRLEVVADENFASQELSKYDYLIVKEGEPPIQGEDVVCVDFAWIKGCLIAGRLLDIQDY